MWTRFPDRLALWRPMEVAMLDLFLAWLSPALLPLDGNSGAPILAHPLESDIHGGTPPPYPR